METTIEISLIDENTEEFKDCTVEISSKYSELHFCSFALSRLNECQKTSIVMIVDMNYSPQQFKVHIQ